MSPSPLLRGHASFSAAVADAVITLDVTQDCYTAQYDPATPPAAAEVVADHGQEIASGCAQLDGRALVALLGALARTLVDMGRCDFATLLDKAAKAIAATGPSPFDSARYSEAIAQFERFSLYVPFRFQCLFRAYWLLHFLARRGLRAEWVFGAALFPFEAHCWVATEGWLLGERTHRLEGLHVLLTVGAAE